MNRKALTEKVTRKQKPRSEGASHLGIRAKNLPGRGDTSNDSKEGQGVPNIFGERKGSKCGCYEYVRAAGGRIGNLLNTDYVEPCR